MRTSVAAVLACTLLLQTTYLAGQGRSSRRVGPGKAGAGKSRAQQALDSRRALLSRAAGPARSSAAELAVRQARNPLNNPQAGTGRIAREATSRRGLGRRPTSTARKLRDARSSKRQTTEQRNSKRRDEVFAGQNRLAATQADRLLAKRLADIDHLRDVAVKNGNERQLEQADRLEELARQQFDRRTNGTKLRANEIFKPTRTEESATTPRPRNDVEPPLSTQQQTAAKRTRKAQGERGRRLSFGFLRRIFRGPKSEDVN